MSEYDLDNKTKAELVHEVRFLQHVNDELYEALGPANDDIVSEAYDSWIATGEKLPSGYSSDDEDDESDEGEYGTYVGGVKVE